MENVDGGFRCKGREEQTVHKVMAKTEQSVLKSHMILTLLCPKIQLKMVTS